MKYILTAAVLSMFSLLATAQSRQPSFARDYPMHFDYGHATIKIDDKEATYDDLLQIKNSDILKVEIYSKKRAVKEFEKETGKHGVVLLTTRKYKSPVITASEDSLAYYKEKGIQAYLKPDVPVLFNGDSTNASWFQFMRRNLQPSVPAENGAPPGIYTVIVHFIINEDGTISEVCAEEDPGFGTGVEAVRLMSRSPLWHSGLYKGKPIKSYNRQPITFVVSEME